MARVWAISWVTPCWLAPVRRHAGPSPSFAFGVQGLAESFPPSRIGELIGKETLSEEEIAYYAVAAFNVVPPQPMALAAVQVRRRRGSAPKSNSKGDFP